ncbi:BspA family leucine-rich repeat surface protein [Brachyspira hyodysenteriae]|uniref:BspA family leucine-rich repeat surface protein n=1 Tax=Brachyspira hyodysenteriae TaxID=159 RepID=UPI0022CDB775|nr:BspA family leucine-rich repeat surface protein [Brachyspira hyodysenteriae]MCZ9838933.1 BspA family leucine-rich repeat surface protein [Brachyspira hyodysenteriae]MCZ9847843.1 BspA family leucine-rich repeat surface protein [Brachyspira hyodysenteriae]MCZ9873552.1 BspA family leucine-rich repeat surface protein [Brachyspira hyodysenteriae]MCZ9891242.1 BspA family leucine-rich repeat surface protein [Brachyspira hyodysenteriae]MCZ9931237.1 BspA family leucine-rich repeat surface protein [B
MFRIHLECLIIVKNSISLNSWNVSNVTNMSGMFQVAESFNQPLDKWDVSKVTTMRAMFNYAKAFNQDISNWNVSKVEDMGYMFSICVNFNQPINDWDVSKVKTMEGMFRSAFKFNQPLDKWNTSKVENMNQMFNEALKFNQPLNSWNVSNVKTMECMFRGTEAFNQPLDKWDTKKLKTMFGMFDFAEGYNSFDSLANWDLNKVSEMSNLCFKRYEELPLRIKAYLQAFYGSYKDYLTVTKDNVKEIYDLISKDTNKKVLSFKKRLESEFSEELSSVTDNYNFKSIEEAEKYVENNYNKKDDKKVSFINDYKVLIKDKSREVENKVLKYIYLEYLLLKRDVKKLVQIDNIVNLLDKESFIKFIKNVYDETNKETAAFIYGIYGGDEAVKNIYKKEKDTKLSLLIIKLNIESKYALRILYEIYSNTKKSEVSYEADKLIDEVMEKMDISYNEFQLRYSSDFGFNSKGEKELNKDYKLILNTDYSLSLFDIKNNKELKKAPQNLNEDLKEEITKLRKEIPYFMKNTASLLAVLLASGEKYSYDLFKEIFIDNAIMNRFASSLIWNLYDKDDNFVTTFRYSGDGSYSNCEDEEVKIDDNRFVSLASPIEMDDEIINKWRKQLEDYEIAQPLQQLTIIKLDKDNLKSELEKIDNPEIAYGTFKAFGARYGMYTEYIGYDVVSSYSLKSKNGDTFSIYANVNSNTDFHDRVKIDIYFTNENYEEVSKRFIYTLLVLMILDFRLTDLF